ITLILVSLYSTAAFLLKIVIPLSLSRSLLSMINSPVSWLSRNTWVACKILSTRVVLPWSTWAMMAIFLICIICGLQRTGSVVFGFQRFLQNLRSGTRNILMSGFQPNEPGFI